MLNSLLHIPKTQGNFNCAGSFATILLSCLEDNGYQVKTLKKHSKFEDLLIVTKNGRTQSIIIGDESACKILKRLDSQKEKNSNKKYLSDLDDQQLISVYKFQQAAGPESTPKQKTFLKHALEELKKRHLSIPS